MHRPILSLVAIFVLAGCGDLILPAEPDGGGDEEELVGDGGLDARSDGRVPRADSGTMTIASLNASTSRITQGESVQFTAIVSDTLGISDITSGELSDDHGAHYANLTPTSSFSVSVTLSWQAIHAASPIQFAAPGAQRMFVATFHNRLGQTVSASVPITLHCAPDERTGACNGVCTDLWSNTHCGQCGTQCSTTCMQGACR